MEKLVYALFGDVSASPAAIASELFPLGARRVAVNVSDEHVAPKLGSRITRLDPTLGAVVSFWLESEPDRRAIERALASTASDLAGYSVLESVALSNRTHLAAPSQRTPGINMIACIAPKVGQPKMPKQIFFAYRTNEGLAEDIIKGFYGYKGYPNENEGL